MPFNNGSLDTIAKDKDFSYELLSGEIKMPKTKAYLDPNCDKKYSHYILKNSLEDIVVDIEENFSYPVVVKMNRGHMGIHVYKCKDRDFAIKAFNEIFNKEQQYYDYIVLVQEFVEIKKEYRVIWFKGEIILLYEKVCDKKNINLSPFHNSESKAVLINDKKIKGDIFKFLLKSTNLEKFEYLGIDVVQIKDESFVLIELNSQPAFNFFVRDNGESDLVEMYKKILNNI